MKVPLLVVLIFSEPVKLIFVNKLYTSVFVYVFKINDDNSSSIEFFSSLLSKLGKSAPPKNSTDLSKLLKTAIGCDPSTMFCKNEKPDAPACNSNYQFNNGFKNASSFIFMSNFDDI